MPEKTTSKTTLLRRHPLLSLAGLLMCLCLGSIGIFLATFDLNAYRESLALRLATALGQPVTIGSANMSWRGGPAFDIGDIRIGNTDTEASGEIAHLFLEPRLLPLLTGQVVFDDMLLEGSHYRLVLLPSDPSTETKTLLFLKALLQTVHVRNLTVVDGQLTVDDRRTAGESPPARIEGIELKLRNLAAGRSCKIRLHARLDQREGFATLGLTGRAALAPDLGNWREARSELQLRLEDLAMDELVPRLSLPENVPVLSGKATLTLSTEGNLAGGLLFDAGLDGTDLSLAWQGQYRHPPAVKKVTASGTLSLGNDLTAIHNLAIHLDHLNLQGHLSLQRGPEQPWIEGTLSSSALPLAEIRKFLPDRIGTSEQTLLQRNLEQGTLTIDHLRFAAPRQGMPRTGNSLPLTAAHLSLRNARLQLPGDAPPLESLNVNLALQDGRWQMTEGTARLLGGPVRFSGMATVSGDETNYALSANWDAPAENLCKRLITTKPWSGKAGGIIPLSLSLSGPAGGLRGSLRADLTGFAFGIPNRFSKPGGHPGELRLAAVQTAKAWLIENSRLTLPPFDVQFAGKIGTTDGQPLDLRLKMEPVALDQGAAMIPPLEAHAIRGSLSLEGKLEGPALKPDFNGQVHLKEAGLTLQSLEADLRDITGTIDIRDGRARFRGVKARLGQSPATLDGELTSGAAKGLRLHVKAPRMLAGELIFPGSKVVFKNLDGTIRVDGTHLHYENIRFDLQNGRNFHLEGSQNLSTPVVAELGIHAGEASIDEVLALWEESPPADAGESESDFRLLIHATVDRGRYGHLAFNDAKATIVSDNDTVTLSPLTFRIDRGTGSGTLLIDHSDPDRSMLSINGELKDIDVASLQSDLLQQRGLVTGKLDAGFDLQGPASNTLLTEGSGHAQIRIRDGVLLKFSFLSKVFSLLNVSQIFTLHLPDMAQKGMPFTTLDATVGLAGGRLTTEDLAVTSNAMNLSLVGDYDLRQDRLDLVMGVKPFGTVDKIVSKIPLAGWILTGESKALITAHFRIHGPGNAPEVEAIPITSVSEKVLGIFQRVLGLPGKVVSDVGQLFQSKDEDKEQPLVPVPAPPKDAP